MLNKNFTCIVGLPSSYDLQIINDVSARESVENHTNHNWSNQKKKKKLVWRTGPTHFMSNNPNSRLKYATTILTSTCESTQSNDWTWLRDIESPISAHVLSLIVSRNLSGSKGGNSQSLGFHLQYRYPVSGRPLLMQFWWLSINEQLRLVYVGPDGLGIQSPVRRSHFSSKFSATRFDFHSIRNGQYHYKENQQNLDVENFMKTNK